MKLGFLVVASLKLGFLVVTCNLYRSSACNWGRVVNVGSRELILTLGSSHKVQFSKKADFLLPLYYQCIFLVGRKPKRERG